MLQEVESKIAVPSCTYHQGMFGNDPPETEVHLFNMYGEPRSSCYHEAGHAIICIALGLGCSSVMVSALYKNNEAGQLGAAYGGETRPHQRWPKLMPRWTVRELVTEAVSNCAGPAAEYQFCHLWGLPQRGKYSAFGDYLNIRKIKNELIRRGKKGSLAERIGWRRAQKLVAEHWSAIEWLAEDLWLEFIGEDLEHPALGDCVKATIPGRRVWAIWRQSIKTQKTGNNERNSKCQKH